MLTKAIDQGNKPWYQTTCLLIFIIFGSENWVELNVYFQQMDYILIEQQPAYDKESLMGKSCDKESLPWSLEKPRLLRAL